MFETIRNAWKVAEIRKKLLFTLLIIIIFRFGSALTVPFLELSKVQSWMDQNATGGNFLEYLNVLTGGALSKATIFSLSITPYINASIIMQLLTYAIPPLERLQSEGEEGRKRINQITAIVSLGLSIFMSIAYYFTLKNMGAVEYRDLTSRQLLYQQGGTFQYIHRIVRIQTTLEAERSVRIQAKTTSGLANPRRMKTSGFQEYVGGLLRHAGIQTAEHATDTNMPNYQ